MPGSQVRSDERQIGKVDLDARSAPRITLEQAASFGLAKIREVLA